MISPGKTLLLTAAFGLAMAGTALAGNLPAYGPLPATGTVMKNKLPSPPTDTMAAESTVDWRSAGTPGAASTVTTRAYGSFGIPYTTARVQATAGAAGASAASMLSSSYPYRSIGKLFFNTPQGRSWCSASLIMKSVMVTAAHCVGDFGSRAYFSGWTYYPGHYGATGATTAQIAPFGTWTMQAVKIAPSWYNGSDTGSGSARNNDLAVFIVRKNGGGQFIGDVTGWMSYAWNNYSFVQSAKTGNLRTAAVSTLGYPALMDGGNIMQRTDGPTYTTKYANALQLWQGSNFTGGSSGGPWIVNFAFNTPVLTGGAVAGLASAKNRVIGVTSWGSSDPNAPKDNYSSQFGQNTQFPNASYTALVNGSTVNYGAGNIGALLRDLCSMKPAGSTKSYAELGYCTF